MSDSHPSIFSACRGEENKTVVILKVRVAKLVLILSSLLLGTLAGPDEGS